MTAPVKETWSQKKRRHWKSIFHRLRTQPLGETVIELIFVPYRIGLWLILGFNFSELDDWSDREMERKARPDAPRPPQDGRGRMVLLAPGTTRKEAEELYGPQWVDPETEPEPVFLSPFVVVWRWITFQKRPETSSGGRDNAARIVPQEWKEVDEGKPSATDSGERPLRRFDPNGAGGRQLQEDLRHRASDGGNSAR